MDFGGNFCPGASPLYILSTSPSCFRLFWQEARRAASRARESAGSRIAARMAMIAMTTSSSISVKAFFLPMSAFLVAVRGVTLRLI